MSINQLQLEQISDIGDGFARPRQDVSMLYCLPLTVKLTFNTFKIRISSLVSTKRTSQVKALYSSTIGTQKRFHKMSNRRKLIIDCDAGTDDAQAILMATVRKDVEILAITAVFGNANLSNTSKNILHVLQVCGRLDIPVFKGCSFSMCGTSSISDGYHGKDGLGDLESNQDVDTTYVRDIHASQAMVDLVRKYPGEISLVALGPLTNIATCLLLDADFGRNLKACFIMGGNSTGRGNITPTAEFNFCSDPEAAKMVLRRLNSDIIWIPMELCEENSFSWDWYDKFTMLSSAKAKFIRECEAKMVGKLKDAGFTYYPMWDQLAMAVFIKREVAVEVKEVYATVECHGSLTKGQCVVDWKGQLKKTPNVSIVTKVNKDLYEHLIIEGHNT